MSHEVRARGLTSPHSRGCLLILYGVLTPLRLGVACTGIVVVLAASACTGSGGTTESALPSMAPVEVGTIPTVQETAEAYPSFPAGIPSAEPIPPREDALAPQANLSPRLTIASFDMDTAGVIVGGFVNGVVEDGGDCQYIITGPSGSQFVAQTVGVENVSTTSCGSTLIPAEVVPSGTYSVELRYVSDEGDARSDAISVRVP